MKLYAKTDVGRKREINQDYVYVTDKPIGPFPQSVLWSPMEWADIKPGISLPNTR